MRCHLTAFALLLVSITVNAQKKHQPADLFAGLDTSFARVLKDWHCAGFSVAIIEKDSVLYVQGFGYRDLDRKLPVTPHTLFAIGSCTKAFTSSLVGLLEKDGLVSLDEPVRTYLPELKFFNEQLNNNITLRDMMCHRTGLPRYDYSWYIFTSSRDSILKRIQYMEPSAGVREKWQYNNLMFLGQGMVVEKLTGRSWEDNISDKIFKPLGMDESGFSIKDLQKSGDASLGYGLKRDSVIRKLDYHDIHDIGPAGEINSNALNMAAWVTTWINGGKYHGKEILPANYVGDAISAQMTMGGGAPAKETPDVFFSSYGLGWMLSSYRGHYRVEHGGNIDGFSASVSFFPSDSVGIVVLTNQNASQVPAIVRNMIVDRLLHLPHKDWSSFLKAADDKARKAEKDISAHSVSDRKTGTHPTHTLTDYTGIYSNPAFGSFEVSLQQDSLFAVLGAQTWWLKHYHYDVFDPLDKDPKDGYDTTQTVGFKLQFRMDPSGDISSVALPLEASSKDPAVFTRSQKVKPMTADQLRKYVGEYTIASVNAKVYLKENTLYFFVPGQPEYELANVGPDKFALKTLNGFFAQFVLNDKGEVTAVLAIQPNGTFKATKK
jgi:CubicO group peptidase (beta-lactamase class C family)